MVSPPLSLSATLALSLPPPPPPPPPPKKTDPSTGFSAINCVAQPMRMAQLIAVAFGREEMGEKKRKRERESSEIAYTAFVQQIAPCTHRKLKKILLPHSYLRPTLGTGRSCGIRVLPLDRVVGRDLLRPLCDNKGAHVHGIDEKIFRAFVLALGSGTSDVVALGSGASIFAIFTTTVLFLVFISFKLL